MRFNKRGRRSRWQQSLPERFWAKVQRGAADECWVWLASRTSTGYGQFFVEKGPRKAHRVAYELTKGQIPDGLHIDHLCRTPLCVNPDHLELVTLAENNRRAAPFRAYRLKTHCRSGHEFTAANVYWDPTRNYRRCRTCERVNRLASYHRRKARGEQELAS